MSRSNRTMFLRDSVFRFGARPQVCRVEVKAGSPCRRISVALTEDEVNWLDCACCEIRRTGGWRGVTRSALLRALIRVVREKGVALSGIAGEDELVDVLRRELVAKEL